MNNSRRGFFKAGLMAVAFYPLLKISDVAAKTACLIAEKCPQGAPTDKKVLAKLFSPSTNPKQAKKGKSLAYIVNAADSKHKKYKAGANCGNCTHYKKPSKAEKGLYAKCAMVGNKYVPSCAWCKTHVNNKKCA